MNKAKIKELEGFLFNSIEDFGLGEKYNYGAAILIADIVGVLIDLKPASRLPIPERELPKLNVIRLLDLLEGLGLKHLSYVSHDLYAHYSPAHETKDDFFESRIEHTYKLFVAKDEETLKKAYNISIKFEKTSELLSDEEQREATRAFGRILGYPETAIDCFVSPEKEFSYWRYFAHSSKHADEEFEAYDLKLNKVLAKYAPKTTIVFSSEEDKRWLN